MYANKRAKLCNSQFLVLEKDTHTTDDRSVVVLPFGVFGISLCLFLFLSLSLLGSIVRLAWQRGESLGTKQHSVCRTHHKKAGPYQKERKKRERETMRESAYCVLERKREIEKEN